MGTLLIFIYKMAVAMLAIFAVYKVLLARVRRPRFCRIVLLATYMLAPLAVWLSGHGYGSSEALPAESIVVQEYTVLPADEASVPVWPRVLMWIWIGGVGITGAFMLLSLFRVWHLVYGCRRVRRIGRARLVVTDDSSVSPFSFGRTMVVNDTDLAADGSMIIAHELQHIVLGHSVDLMIARSMAVLMWFNPVAWMLVRELSCVHEFEVDGRVISSGVDRRLYQYMLLRRAAGYNHAMIVNGLNHSSIKQRILMMQQPGGAASRRWLAVSLLPVALIATLLSSRQPFLSEIANLRFDRVEDFDAVQADEADYVESLDDLVVVGYMGRDNTDEAEQMQKETVASASKQAKAKESAVISDAAPPVVTVESAGSDDVTSLAAVRGHTNYTRGRIRKVRPAGTVSTPFYYVDGDPYERLPENLDPSQIESVTIRRDHPEYPDGVVYIKLRHE